MTEKPLLKAGIISDIQAYDVREDWGMSNLVKALKILAPFQPDVFINPGDLADLAEYPGAYKLYNRIFAEFFPEQQPQQIICAGNHDVWDKSGQSFPEMLDVFSQNLGIPRDEVCHTEFKGYDFIAVTADSNEDYNPDKLHQIKELLDDITTRKPEQPVFVVTHYPPQDTMSCSLGRNGNKNLRELFNNYKQVVSFSGHTHYPLEDERSIWQKEFTAVTCSTLSYGCIKEPAFNTCNRILPFAREAAEALYMEVFADKIIIRRFNITDQHEIKPEQRWEIPLPYDPASPKYGEDRALTRTAPTFADDAQIVLRYDYGFAFAIFDAAKHEDMVQFYRIKVSVKNDDNSWSERDPVLYVSDFYRLEQHRSDREFFKLPHDLLAAGKINRIEIYPMESFGKCGQPLVLERLIPQYWKFREFDPLAAPQE